MPMHRKNKSSRGNVERGSETPWFVTYRRRNRRRAKLARAMRQRQRRIANGKR